MNTTTNSNATIVLIQQQIDRLGDCTTDGPVVFVNGFGRVCAKVTCRKGTIAGWGNNIEEALNQLAIEITKKD